MTNTTFVENTMLTPETIAYHKEFLSQATEQGMTYEEIGKTLNCTRERVRQLYNKYKLTKPVELRKSKKAKKELDVWVQEPCEKEFTRVCRKKYINKKANAKQNGIEFTVAFEDLVFPEVCPVLGITLDYYNPILGDTSPSFDRIDPDQGYTKENTIIISFRANKIKQDASAEELRAVYLFLQRLRPYVGKFA